MHLGLPATTRASFMFTIRRRKRTRWSRRLPT
ncbi:MAG: hypothetical protein ACLS7Z_11880 [Christensenellales bacterium]